MAWHFCWISERTRKISSHSAGISAARYPRAGIAKELPRILRRSGHIPACVARKAIRAFREWLATNFPPNAALFGIFSGVLRTHASRWSNWGAIHVANTILSGPARRFLDDQIRRRRVRSVQEQVRSNAVRGRCRAQARRPRYGDR